MSQSMSLTQREALEQAVTRFFHMCNTHCPGNLAPLMTYDVELIDVGEVSGQEDVNKYFVWLWQAYPEMVYRVENMLVDGNTVAAEVTTAAGPQGRIQRCVIFQFRDGLIRRIRSY